MKCFTVETWNIWGWLCFMETPKFVSQKVWKNKASFSRPWMVMAPAMEKNTTVERSGRWKYGWSYGKPFIAYRYIVIYTYIYIHTDCYGEIAERGRFMQCSIAMSSNKSICGAWMCAAGWNYHIEDWESRRKIIGYHEVIASHCAEDSCPITLWFWLT